jgi:hypothetical protein
VSRLGGRRVMVCLRETHGHDFLRWRSWVGFSLGQWPFGHVIPLERVAGCGVCSGKEGQGKARKARRGRKSGNRAGRGGS